MNSNSVHFGGWKLNNGRRTIKRKRGEQRKGKTPNGEDWNSVSISISFEVEFSWLRSSSGRQPRARPSFLFENSASSWNICHSLSRCHRLMTSWLPSVLLVFANSTKYFDWFRKLFLQINTDFIILAVNYNDLTRDYYWINYWIYWAIWFDSYVRGIRYRCRLGI